MPEDVRPLSDGQADAWDAFVVAHPLGRAYLTSASRDYWRVSGWALSPLGLWSGDRLVAGLALATKRVPYTPWVLARVVGLLVDPDDVAGSAAALLKEAEAAAWRQRALEVDVRCRIFNGTAVNGLDCFAAVRQTLVGAGYSEGPADSTYLKAIDQEDEKLLESFSSKCRRDARKGLREGVSVAGAETEDLLDAFCQAHRQMSSRKGLETVPEATYGALRPLHARSHVKVFAAMHDGRVCNMALVDMLGVPKYTLGAVTEAGMAKGCPPTGQVLHYGIMQYFRDRGRRYYDWGGSPGPVPVEGHPNYTVWRFKYEFNNQFVLLLPAYRRPFGVLGRWATAWARRSGRLTL